jgi:hypothetical protein
MVVDIIMRMKKYHQTVIEFFGEEWFQENWRYFCEVRKKFEKGSFNKEITELELSLHPLLKEVFRYQSGYEGALDFDKIPDLGPADFIFSHLGRDLELLKNEINSHGNKIKEDLKEPDQYESHRFNILVAAGYKLLGYKVEFIATGKDKRPDLLVENETKLLIESKQRNQSISDKDRYRFFGEVTEECLPLLRAKNLHDIQLNIELKGDTKLSSINEQVLIDIRNLISKNKKSTNAEYSIGINKLSDNKSLLKLLLDSGHFREYPVYTRTEDGFIASDPINKNVVWLNKSVSPDKIPSAIYEELYDANSKVKNGEKLIVYLDLERGYSDWVERLSQHILDNMDEYLRDLPNIDAYVISQTPLKYLGKSTVIQPTFNFIGEKTKWSDTPDVLNIFGFQGHTGMDGYVLKDFIMTVGSTLTKCISCANCGYRMEGIATNLEVGEKISQVSLPCFKCGSPMDMTLKTIQSYPS